MSFVYTFGCRLNSYESQSIKQILDVLNIKDAIAINTCTITNEAERQCRQKIRQLKKLNPASKIIVTGCAAELHMDMFFEMSEVDFVLNNKAKLNVKAYQQIADHFNDKKEKSTHQIFGENIEYIDNEINYVYNFENKSRAFLKIQDGCNHYCSFCIVPFVRGKMKSTPMDRIFKETENLLKSGYNEIVLTGVDITDYGTDLKDNGKTTLSNLCDLILEKFPELSRLRLSSVDVSEVDDKMLELLTEHDRFCSYLHISLQSGSNKILKAMRRRHTRENVFEFCEKVRKIKPFAAFGADIIAGFPSESQSDFEESLDLVKNAPITFVHAFPYSQKEQTLAARMKDDVEKSVKKDRVLQLIEAGKVNMQKLNQKMLGHEFLAIIEKGGIARAENFAEMVIPKTTIPKNLMKVKCIEIVDDKLIAEVI